MNMVFASFASLPGRIAYTFSSGIGLPEVRSEVDSNLSTTTCNFPPESFAISFNRASIASRPHPIPRFASVHDESVSRVPHPTSFPISAAIDFSSTDARATPPLGRAAKFGCTFACTGSAGSRASTRCAKVGAVLDKRMTRTKRTELNDRPQYPTCRLFMICDSPFDLAISEFGILTRIAFKRATRSLLLGTPQVQVVDELWAELSLPM